MTDHFLARLLDDDMVTSDPALHDLVRVDSGDPYITLWVPRD